jgi:hypothetical protein
VHIGDVNNAEKEFLIEAQFKDQNASISNMITLITPIIAIITEFFAHINTKDYLN